MSLSDPPAKWVGCLSEAIDKKKEPTVYMEAFK